MTEQEKMEELVDVLELDLGEFDRDTKKNCEKTM